MSSSTHFICVLSTCADVEQARRIAEALVSERLVACVNVLPGVESIYRWQGNIERAKEVVVLAKTMFERFQEVRDRIVSLHSYDTPEIICLPIEQGLEKYLSWIRDSLDPETPDRA